MGEDNISKEELDKVKKERYERKKKNNREYMKDLRENYREGYNEYQRNYMAKWRKEHPNWRENKKSKPKQKLDLELLDNKGEFDRAKYMQEYFQREDVKKGRKIYCREYMRDKREYDKISEPGMSFKEWRKINKSAPKILEINNLVNHIKEIRKYPADFPREEFNKRLDDILNDKPLGIEDKILKDIVYGILENGKPSTMEKMVMVYHNPDWEKAIDCFMNSREYFSEIIAGDKIYMRKK